MLFALAMSAYAFMMFVTIPELRGLSGGVEIFDLRPLGYGEEEALLILASMPDAARDYYRHVQIPVDFLYPLLLGLFGMFTLAWARRRVAIPRWSIIVPLAVTTFDYLENVGVLILLAGHTQPVTMALASVCSIAKSMLTTAFMTGLLALLVLIAAKPVAN